MEKYLSLTHLCPPFFLRTTLKTNTGWTVIIYTDTNTTTTNNNIRIFHHIQIQILLFKKTTQIPAPPIFDTIYSIRFDNSIRYIQYDIFDTNQLLYSNRRVPSETQCLLENISLGRTDVLSAHRLF
jgi:hypothetical protein